MPRNSFTGSSLWFWKKQSLGVWSGAGPLQFSGEDFVGRCGVFVSLGRRFRPSGLHCLDALVAEQEQNRNNGELAGPPQPARDCAQIFGSFRL